MCGRSYHLIKEFAGTIHVVRHHGITKTRRQSGRRERKKSERELPLCNNFLIPDIWYSFDFLDQNSHLLSPLLASRSSVSLPPVALPNCSEVSFQEDAPIPGHREMTSPLRTPTAQSLSVRPRRKTISAFEPVQQMCPFQDRGEGSRVKADNNRQSCAIQNPWTCSVWEGWASTLWGRCVFSVSVLWDVCWTSC